MKTLFKYFRNLFSNFVQRLILSKNRSKHGRLIKQYGLFDNDWYVSQFPASVDFNNDPLKHFLRQGILEDKSPHPLFDLRWYRNYYKLKKFTNPLLHFAASTGRFHRKPNAFLDTRWYAENYLKSSDLKAYEILNHYYVTGEKINNRPCEDFDPEFYRGTYAGVGDFKYGLLAHYLDHGRVEKKLPFDPHGKEFHPLCISLQQVNIDHVTVDETLSPYFDSSEKLRSFFFSCLSLPEDIPLRFIPGNYARYNSDLKIFENNPLEAIRHFLLHGSKENRIYRDFNKDEYTNSFYSIWRNINKTELLHHRPNVKTCVLVHIFYPELYPEIKTYLDNLSGFTYDIFFNLVENNWTPQLHNLVRSDFPDARIIVSKNIGRDIGGFFNLLSYIRNIQSYNAFLLIHSKKSPHISEELSSKWRNDLLESTIGSREVVLQNMYLLEDHNTGLVGAALWRHRGVEKNYEKYRYMLKVLDISAKNSHCDYLSGTIMWVNARVVDYLYSRCNKLELEDGNDRSLEFHMDGQYAHTIERIFGNICQQLSLKMIFR
jgi:hypothetical protein